MRRRVKGLRAFGRAFIVVFWGFFVLFFFCLVLFGEGGEVGCGRTGWFFGLLSFFLGCVWRGGGRGKRGKRRGRGEIEKNTIEIGGKRKKEEIFLKRWRVRRFHAPPDQDVNFLVPHLSLSLSYSRKRVGSIMLVAPKKSKGAIPKDGLPYSLPVRGRKGQEKLGRRGGGVPKEESLVKRYDPARIK